MIDRLRRHLKMPYLTLRSFILNAAGGFLKGSVAWNPRDIKKILFIRIDRIGDLVLSTPMIRALKEHFPSATLCVLASQTNQDLLKHNPFVDKVYIYDRQNFLRKWNMWRRLRQERFNLVIDPIVDYTLESSLIACFSGAKARLGYAAWGREAFYNHPVALPDQPMHMADLISYLVRHIGIQPACQPQLYLSDEERTKAGAWISHHGLSDRHYRIALHPGAHYDSQKWPPAHFSRLIAYLQERDGYQPILLGGPADRNIIEKIVRPCKDGIPCLITENLREFMALLSCCHVLICNNSGPMHMAAALDTPTISIMGPTEKEKWSPLGRNDVLLRMDDLPCIGCNLGYCKIKTHDCMRLITPELVINAIVTMLKTGPDPVKQGQG